MHEGIVLSEVKELRRQMPRIGTRKLHYMLADRLQKHQISIGRNKLFDLLEDNGMLVRNRKRKSIRTTDSNHSFKKHPNLISELEIIRPNQVWVSDITYISLGDKFCYLNLITDAYSRKIVGYCLHPTLQVEGSLKALRMAIDALGGRPEKQLIHHSDRGGQYCCGEYIALLGSYFIAISMTEKGSPYENAIAERVNGILKNEFNLNWNTNDFKQAEKEVIRAIGIYNNDRIHMSCNMLTPQKAHQMEGSLPSKWKRKKEVAMVT